LMFLKTSLRIRALSISIKPTYRRHPRAGGDPTS
jgi:hypothetical protein